MISDADEKKLQKEIGGRIRSERLKRNISPEEFAGLLKISVSFVGLIERGLRGTSIKLLVNMCEIFGCKLEEIIFGKKFVLREGDNEEYNLKLSSINSLARTLNLDELNFIICVIKSLNSVRNKNNNNTHQECFY